MEWLFGVLIISVFLVLKYATDFPHKSNTSQQSSSLMKKKNLILIRIDKLRNPKTLIILHIFVYSLIFWAAWLSVRFVFNRLRCPPPAYYDEEVETKYGEGCVLDEKYAHH
jgi:hypothetical protein